MAERLVAKGVASERSRSCATGSISTSSSRSRARAPTETSSAFAETDRVALYSGNIGAKQGFDDLIAAARRLAQRADIMFFIAGEGPAKPDARGARRDLANVRFLPFQPVRAPRRSFLGLADLHVLPQAADAADLVLPPSSAACWRAAGASSSTAAPGRSWRLPRRRGDRRAARRRGGAGRAIERAAEAREDDPANVTARLALAAGLSRADRLPALAAALFAAPAAAPNNDAAPAAPEEIAA